MKTSPRVAQRKKTSPRVQKYKQAHGVTHPKIAKTNSLKQGNIETLKSKELKSVRKRGENVGRKKVTA